MDIKNFYDRRLLNGDKLRYAPMWENKDVYYHYSDKERAGEDSILKWVVMDADYFIGTWQFKEDFAIAVFDTEQEAEDVV